MMKAERIFETVLYAHDLAAMARFYREVLGLELLQRTELVLVFRCGPGVLLIFDPEQASTAGRNVPSHGAIGPGHIAFPARSEDLDAWRQQLAAAGVEIEAEREWSSGGTSIYFRDPAGNSVELASPTLWGGGWDF